jgi:hypothetical protein
MTMLQLRNGTILTNDWMSIQPTARTYQTINVDVLIRSIRARLADWQTDGQPLETVHIPVADMFAEFADILSELGLTDAYQLIGITDPNPIEVKRHG